MNAREGDVTPHLRSHFGSEVGYWSTLADSSLEPDSFTIDGVTYTVTGFMSGISDSNRNVTHVIRFDRSMPSEVRNRLTLDFESVNFNMINAVSLGSNQWGFTVSRGGGRFNHLVQHTIKIRLAALRFSYTPAPYATNNYAVVDAPTGLLAQAAGGRVALRWEAPVGVTGITGYRIERDVDGHGGQIQVREAEGTGSRVSCGNVSWFFTQFDRLGKRVDTATGIWFADSLADLNAQDLQQMASLEYHVFALTADGESLPVSVDVPVDSFRRWWDYGVGVRDASVYEGRDSRNRLNTLDFEVTLRQRLNEMKRVQVEYTTISGTATPGTTCGAGIDFIFKRGTLEFGPVGNPLQTIKVTVCDDAVDDSWETLELSLFNASGGTTIQRSTATGLIINSEDINSSEAQQANTPATGAPTIDGTARVGGDP